ncbi:MAG: alpha-amylase family glycosyl hydrolase [Prevotella sp.]|jgi:maltose alpha-D-glucosyltransferase/alpha-amylase
MTHCKFFLLLLFLASALTGRAGTEPVPQWFRNAVIYEIYPSAFADSNGDGMGDLAGITRHLDDIKALGCNTIWINACFSSEFKDGGYDVTDYYRIAPRYGTNEDMAMLLRAAHERGIRVLLDLVAGHTSNHHPWFLQSMKKETNEFSDRYIWTNDTAVKPPKFVTPEPSDTIRNGNYRKNYFPFQPALNYGYGKIDPSHPWEEPITAAGPTATRKSLMHIMDFWADMGCDGFRIDMAGSLVKNDPTLEATSRLWNEVRAHYLSQHPEGVLLAEWGHPDKARRIGFTADFLFQFGLDGWRDLFCNETGVYRYDTCYFDVRGTGTPKRFIHSLLSSLDSLQNEGMVCLPTGNHDVQRLNCGRRNSPEELKTALTFLLLMPCVPCIYYGDEIGMRYREGLPDIEGSMIKAGNRAGSRTKMEWNRVAEQSSSPASIYNTVKALLQLRASHPALGTNGGIVFLTTSDGHFGCRGTDYPLTFIRQDGKERFLISVNPSGREVTATYPRPEDLTEKTTESVLRNADNKAKINRKKLKVTLAPTSFLVCKLK